MDRLLRLTLLRPIGSRLIRLRLAGARLLGSRLVRSRKSRALIGVLAISLVGFSALPAGRSIGRAMAQALADPLSILALRSPGVRAAGALTQTKPVSVVDPGVRSPAPGAPTQRVLSTVRTRPLLPFATDVPGTDAFVPDPAGADPSVGLLDGVDPDSVVPVSSLFVPPGSGGPIFSGGGSGGAGEPTPDTDDPDVPPDDTGTTPDPDDPPIVVPPTDPDTPPLTLPVPEPATWLTMIFGFLFVGAGVRRRRRRERGRNGGVDPGQPVRAARL